MRALYLFKHVKLMKTFLHKRVLITGAASGIGKLMAKLALEKGAELIIWDIHSEQIQQTMIELDHLGTIHSYIVDVSNPEEVARVGALVLAEVGVVDVVINNAGIVVGKFFHDHTQQDIIRTMNVNTNAPMYVTKAFLPEMMRQNSGHICNIASSAGLISNPKMSVYAASKWAVIGWSDSLRLEMKQLKLNVGVTTVTPYYINTGMFDGVKSIIPILKPEKVARRVIRGIERNKIYVSMPWSVHFVRLAQGILPFRFFDWFVGKVLGVYKTMEHFTGRK